MAPRRSSCRRSSVALVMLPLCAIATLPLLQATENGCALSSTVSPAVEYRVWPMASSPGSSARTSLVKMSATWPIVLCVKTVVPSEVQIPALSWPRCCSEYSPRYASLAASGWPYMATTPHSSWNLSNMRLECLLVCGSERCDFPGTQCVAALSNFHPCFHCLTDHQGFDPVFFGDFGHFLGMRGGNQDTRRRFVEGHDLGTEVAGDVDLRADFSGSEAALRQCHGEAAIGEIVGGFGEAGGDDFADGRLHALFHVERKRRRQAPGLLFDLLGVLCRAEARLVAGPDAAQQDHGAAGVLERQGERCGS